MLMTEQKPASRKAADEIARLLKAAGRPDLMPLKKVDFMFQRQQSELTPTMLRFDHDTHVIRITSDSHGFLTVTARERTREAETLTFRFPKTRRVPHNQRKPRPVRAAVYTFKGTDRLWDLAVEPQYRVQAEA